MPAFKAPKYVLGKPLLMDEGALARSIMAAAVRVYSLGPC